MTEQPPPQPTPQPAPQPTHQLEQQRRANRDAIAAMGVDPYGQRTTGLISIAHARARYNEAADAAWRDAQERAKKGEAPLPDNDPRPLVAVAGRLVLKRDGGKLMWFQIRDITSGADSDQLPPQLPQPDPQHPHQPGAVPIETACAVKDLQLAVSKADAAPPSFDISKTVDLGDIVIATGRLMKTKTGEVTIWATSFTLAAKSLAPPPEKWEGLTDIESRYRRRYVDLWSNPAAMQVLTLRSRIAAVIRAFLHDRGYIEVETPVLQTLAGGAAARPFATHMNALGIDLFMRVAPELYLKRLLVAGMPRVFEWSRNFRNEGLDRSHNPEFTMLELYEAFADYNTMRELVESLFRACAKDLAPDPANLRLPFATHLIDYAPPFDVVTYADLFARALGFDMNDPQRVRAAAHQHEIPLTTKSGVPLDHLVLVGALFDIAERHIDPARPTFVIDYPAPLCPLTRQKRDNPDIAERFELYIGGMEIANAYTELNDPDIQEAKFRQQLQGLDDQEATFRTFDHDFIDALKVGMPPAGGLGIGIDRLCMVLLNQRTIRDVLLFPMMKPID